MASKSTGQIVGTFVGAVVGFFVPALGVALGAAIGGAIGGAIDPPKGPTIAGPRLDDLSFQTSTLGAPLGRAYGTVPVLGNVVWLEGDAYREVITSEEQGGKGGSSATYETAHYYATFAVSLLRVPDATKTVALRRMWIGSNLVYDAGSDDIESIIASNSGSVQFTFYSGTDDQQPNTRWQADKGANSVSGFPGRCYIVIYDLDLEPYSRSLAMAQVKVELTVGDSVPDIDLLGSASDTLYNKMSSASVDLDKAEYMLLKYDLSGNLIAAEIREYRYGEADRKVSDIDVVLNAGYGYTAPSIMPCQQYYPGKIESYAIISLYLGGPLRSQLAVINSGGYILGAQENDGVWEYGEPYIFAAKNGEAWAASSSHVAKILHFRDGNLIGNSSIDVKSSSVGYSENYVFVVDATASSAITCVVKKLDYDLNLVDTLTLSVNGLLAVLQVVGDNEFFIRSSAIVSHYSNGVSATLAIGSLLSYYPQYSWSYFSPQTPDYGISLTYNSSPVVHEIYISHATVNQSVAKFRDIVTAECALAGLPSGDIDLTGLTDSDVRGYRIANAASIRSSLEMLQAAYPFDVAPSGYKLRFLSRGGTSLATIPEIDLGATDGGDKLPVLLPVTREMDTQIPYKVSVRYLDPSREYDIAEQYAERPDTASVNERTVELSIVLTGEEAVRIADVLNQKDWVERSSFGPFSLPPTWRAIEPPDVVTVEHRGQSHSIRLTRAEFLPDGRIECSGVYSSAQSYTSSASSQESLTVGQSLIPLRGTSHGLLLDIPVILSQQDRPGVSAAAYGLASGWPGASIVRSEDSGSTYISGFSTTVAAAVFQATTVLGSGRSDIIDSVSVLTVAEKSRNPSLYSVDFSAAAGGQNIAAFGIAGRWEILSFMTVVDNGNDTWTISDFMRGRFGTEWAMSLHEANDLLVVLSVNNTGFIGLPLSALNLEQPYRTVTSGSALDSADDEPFTYTAENLLPISPVYLKGSRHPTTSEWTIEATMRSRTPVEAFSGVDTPDSETPAAYEVDIWENDSYATKLRTLSGISTPSAGYTLADQVTDFGVEQEQIFVDYYKVSPTVGRGRRLRGSLASILESDPFSAEVFTLLHFDGSGATITDVISGHSWTAYGNATQGTSDKKFGSAALAVDGTGDYIGMTFGSGPIGTGDFTFEWWEKPADTANRGRFMLRNSAIGGAGNANGIATAWNGTAWNCYGAGGSQVLGGTSNSTSAYTHMAMERYGTTVRLYKNGVPLASTFSDSSNYSTHIYFYVAVYYSTAVPFNGIIDEFRGTAAARYRGNSFTPPDAPFPDP